MDRAESETHFYLDRVHDKIIKHQRLDHDAIPFPSSTFLEIRILSMCAWTSIESVLFSVPLSLIFLMY